MYQQSPAGRNIMRLVGDPTEIIARGTEIELLGGQMRDAADVLKDIKTRADEQQGQAIDSLRDTIDDSYDTLYEAADLYEPVGPVIRKYGEELDSVQSSLNSHADNCDELWTTYQNTAGTINPYAPTPEEGSDEEEDNEAKQDAYDAWKAEAVLFDGDYDTWEKAFDEAVGDITDEMSGQIEDGKWRTFLHYASVALSWAGLVVGIAALIIGGPILGVIAAVIGVLALIVTICQMGTGDAGWGDLAWAVVGVLPLGKLGKLFNGKSGALSFVDDIAGSFKPSTYTSGGGLYQMVKNGDSLSAVSKLVTGETPADWGAAMDLYRNVPDGPQAFTANFALSTINTIHGHQGKVDTITSGGSSLLSHLPQSTSSADRVKQLQSQ